VHVAAAGQKDASRVAERQQAEGMEGDGRGWKGMEGEELDPLETPSPRPDEAWLPTRRLRPGLRKRKREGAKRPMEFRSAWMPPGLQSTQAWHGGGLREFARVHSEGPLSPPGNGFEEWSDSLASSDSQKTACAMRHGPRPMGDAFG
jgi:hypothetical protein